MPEVVKCTVVFMVSTVLKVLGIICAVLLAITCICALAAPEVDLWGNAWHLGTGPHGTTTQATATDAGFSGLRNHVLTTRDRIRVSWTTSQPRTLLQMSSGAYDTLATPARFSSGDPSTSDDVTVHAGDLTPGNYWYCLSSPTAQNTCDADVFRGVFAVVAAAPAGSVFRSGNWLGPHNIGFTWIVLCLALIVFACVMVCGELHWGLVTTKFTFFYWSFAKGTFYILVGILILGISNILGLATGIIFMIVGVLNIVYGHNTIVHYRWGEVAHRGTTTIVTRREYC